MFPGQQTSALTPERDPTDSGKPVLRNRKTAIPPAASSQGIQSDCYRLMREIPTYEALPQWCRKSIEEKYANDKINPSPEDEPVKMTHATLQRRYTTPGRGNSFPKVP